MLSREQIDRVSVLLGERVGLDALYVYGSEAAERARSDSDVDIAVLPTSRPAPLEVLSLRAELEGLLGRDVDLVVLDNASPILAMQIVRQGRRVVDNNPTRTADFEARLYSRYADLKRVRAASERALVERIQRA